ncbi:MAG: carbohydrate kinase family protein [Nanoarchaeota archaeon]
MVTVHNVGLNNIDLEGRVKETETSQRIKTVNMSISGFLGLRTAFELPPNMGFKIVSGGTNYYVELDPNSPVNQSKMFRNANGSLTILADEKYDLTGALVPSLEPPGHLKEFWQIEVTEATGGGGAHNTAFGQQVYLSEAPEQDIRIKLVVPVGYTLIRDRLPNGLEYSPLAGISDGDASANLNFAPVNGKKITLRSNVPVPTVSDTDLGVQPEDVIVLNTIRGLDYVGLVERVLQANSDARLFLSATDSMIQSLGPEKVWELVSRSDVYVSNREELERMVGLKINDPRTLAEKMFQVQNALLQRESSPGKVYITFGQAGSAALGQERVVYYQDTSAGTINPFKKLNIVNTNGCGDAYLSIVVIMEILGHTILEILNDANAAGHMCATMPTASGTWMATERRIKEFRDSYGRSDFHRYDNRRGEFIRMRM